VKWRLKLSHQYKNPNIHSGISSPDEKTMSSWTTHELGIWAPTYTPTIQENVPLCIFECAHPIIKCTFECAILIKQFQ
jgi:hypothetical protein